MARRAGLSVMVGRIAVLGALVLSLSATVLAEDSVPPANPAPGSEIGPTTVEALTSRPLDLSPPPSLVSHAGGERALDAQRVSRSGSRLELQTDGGSVYCDGIVTDPGTNGRVPDAELCDLWQEPYRDRADAAVSIFALNDMYVARFGEPMCLSSAYRTFEEQAALRRKKGAIAAPAGLSNHGWGLAVDFCPETYTGARGDWLWANAATFGWENPEWARKGGSGFYEPWHWEYVAGVQAIAAAGLS
ncbi:MAG: M15 family metallopeptidase [Actinobacteria bacterium]|nr:M15 family metallopeptidase [Actinomycetota bacterium]MCG2800148.1 M15 family metallopeptidase [Cellulomonas sp.]